MDNLDNENISHKDLNINFEKLIKKIESKLKTNNNSEINANFSLKKQFEILHELSSFPLGKFFLTHKGASAFWTDYILNYPNSNLAAQGINIDGKPLNSVESFILHRSPLTLAHRERFKIFQSEFINMLKKGGTYASIPCGCMRDLLESKTLKRKKANLIGIDIDEEALVLAEKIALEEELIDCLYLKKNDAWKLTFKNEMDAIFSTGLNVYEPSENRIIDLYKRFYAALKIGGKLVVSFLTFPPDFDVKSEWNMKKINKKDFMMEKFLFQSIIGSSWLNFSTSKDIKRILLKIGFNNIHIRFDPYKIYPTAIAVK